MGVTAIDQETFEEYLSQMRSHYTADKVSCRIKQIWTGSNLFLQYHLLGTIELYRSVALRKLTIGPDFNCNSFTNDMVGFLTGNSIPTWISGS